MVEIIKGWYYKADEFQFILIHEYEKTKGVFGRRDIKGEEKVIKRDEIGYFKNLRDLLKRLAHILCKEKIDNGEIKTIKEHIAELKRLEERLNNICQGC